MRSDSTMTSAFAINPAPEIQVECIGPDRVPLVIVDNVTTDKRQSIMAHALEAPFELEGSFMYPGIRARLPSDYVVEVLRPIIMGLYQIYNIPSDKKILPQQADFSLITLIESQLSLMQTVPHFDTHDPYFFAILHYLSPGEHGDTGFFEHVPTGLCAITEESQERYFDSVTRYFSEHGEPPKGYITQSSGQFRLYHKASYKPDRLVIYPGNLLHSTLVKGLDISTDPAKGRLTANIFVRFV
jgi:hypothetical protein